MDQACCRPRPRRCGLPRTRGDGPENRDNPADRSRASPHTRGWTRQDTQNGHDDTGFPAHAGMDPHRPIPDRSRDRLPRTRGDGPPLTASWRCSGPASPHTRGWTRASLFDRLWLAGFPAHAGMDPSATESCSPLRRLPRTRGDGPRRQRRRWASCEASPHTRGWTHDLHVGVVLPLGFPAHAGMDPKPTIPGVEETRLPRTRGDGPLHMYSFVVIFRASPHTRGWTVYRETPRRFSRGFPAHAGMDPDAMRFGKPPERLPRTRGDGPSSRSPSTMTSRASPHTRGWTLGGADRRESRDGFPAHAGMDLAVGPVHPRARRLPRTRGDGPRPSVSASGWSAASPHTRGWTPVDVLPQAAVEAGFPAHAGMDPRRASWTPAVARLPRTRGDGPASPICVSFYGRASPHTRGWTRVCRLAYRCPHGFPAHAGMDPVLDVVDPN